ncbi:unnamed protein product [Porites lobata]|uniref:Uncharacterized protein n=1 Tax=Porites lobata TaxID=104759 RepID=A0ABN8RJY2_9CNID|nr:unnamed protein product [Porites lobata]
MALTDDEIEILFGKKLLGSSSLQAPLNTMYKEKRPSSMLEPDSSFYLSVNYFKTEKLMHQWKAKTGSKHNQWE